MRQKAVLMLLLACVMGAAAVLLARGWLERQTQPTVVVETQKPAPQTTQTTVVVAKLPLKFGEDLNRQNLRVMPWPSDSVPDGSFASIEEVLAGNEHRVALRDIGVNEMVLKSRVSGFGGRATLSAMVGSEKRAVTIRVNDVQGVAGFVLPGDRVDVLFTRSPDSPQDTSGKASPVTDVLLQNVSVLAVDQMADNQKDKPMLAKAVTVEVATADAQKLTLAAQVGTLSLMLRNYGNAAIDTAGTVTVGSLLADARAPAGAPGPALPERSTHSVRIYRGIDESVQEVTPEALRRQAPKPAAPKPRSDAVAWAPATSSPRVTP